MSKTILASVLALALSGVASHAAPLTWELSGWTFDDGGTATGSFVFDAETTTYSDVMISFGGGSLGDLTFNRFDPNSTPSAGGLSFAGPEEMSFFGPTYDTFLANLASDLTDAGGTVFTSNYSVFDISAFGIASNSGIASLVAVPAAVVPLPAALPLLAIAMGGLFGLRRRRT